MCGKNQEHLTRHGFLPDHAIAGNSALQSKMAPRKKRKKGRFCPFRTQAYRKQG